MELAGKYNVYFGTERGVIGHTQCKPDEAATYELKNASKDAEVTSLEWGRSFREIVIGQKDGIVRLYDTGESKFVRTIAADDVPGSGPVVGAEAAIDKLVVVRRSGRLSVWHDEAVDDFEISSDDGTVDCAKCNADRKNVVGAGGEKNDFKLWDIETKKCIFKAKSMGHDSLNLPIPTTIRGITFFECDNKLNACCTREGHILLYDERTQRRPVSKIFRPDNNFTTIASLHKDKQFIVGTSRGSLQIFDFAKPTHPVKSFSKISGGVSSVVSEPFTPYVFSVSFDRYLRVHSIETGKLIYSEYLKQGLTKVLVKPATGYVGGDSDNDDKDEVLIDEEYEKLFDNMETVADTIKNKRTIKGSIKDAKRKKKL